MKPFYLTWLCLCLILSTQAQTSENQASMLDLPYPFETRFARLNDSLELAYTDHGQGEYTLLFIHGLGSYMPVWQKNIASLESQFRCIAVDLPGYGKSSKNDYPYSLHFFSETLIQFIDQLQLKKVIPVGHSMGGQIAVTMALKYPDRFSRLILLAPAGFETFNETEKNWLLGVSTPQFYLSLPEEQIVRNFHLNFVTFPADAQFMIDDRLFMKKTREYERYCRMIPQCVAAMLKEPVFERLPEMKMPVLVVYGENDALIPNRLLHPALSTLQIAQSGLQRLKNGQLVTIPQCGHMLQWEGATTLNTAITEFIAK